MPYYIDELKPGTSESFTRTVTESDVEKFGEVSGDMNPAHFDEEYAKTTMFKTRIAHGVLSASYISTVLGMKMPGPGTIFMSLTTRFKAPVRIGDTVTATCTVREVVTDKRRVAFDCVCKVGDTTVIDGEAMVMAPARPK
ncbi:MAG: MaoC family dehydratase [Alphaproteobacteria bacterium]|nr:MaoC family dehydratase [Alphaproteobacteria bacterium]MBL6938014.1 MaoC family dehydratase [Alphaproteobacteria bacterium]MBL7099161.1 MaoC family dehydratase [Alphaproteobacteria bacterium]